MKRIIIFISVLTFAYLVGSFINISFDISKWTIECRFITSLAGSFAALAVSTYPNIDK